MRVICASISRSSALVVSASACAFPRVDSTFSNAFCASAKSASALISPSLEILVCAPSASSDRSARFCVAFSRRASRSFSRVVRPLRDVAADRSKALASASAASALLACARAVSSSMRAASRRGAASSICCCSVSVSLASESMAILASSRKPFSRLISSVICVCRASSWLKASFSLASSRSSSSCPIARR